MDLRQFPLPAVFAVLALSSFARAQDEAAPTKWNVTVECQMVILPQKDALALLPELLDEDKIEGAYARIQQLIGSGEAQLAANLIARLHDQEKGFAETVEEVRYSTEFDPPQLPQNAPENLEVLKNWPIVAVTPTSFDTRKVGAIFEVTQTISADGALLEVTFSTEHVRFLRWEKVDCGKLADGNRLFIEQAVFHAMKNTGTFALENGRRVLIGSHKVPDAPERIELFLFKAKAVSAKKR